MLHGLFQPTYIASFNALNKAALSEAASFNPWFMYNHEAERSIHHQDTWLLELDLVTGFLNIADEHAPRHTLPTGSGIALTLYEGVALTEFGQLPASVFQNELIEQYRLNIDGVAIWKRLLDATRYPYTFWKQDGPVGYRALIIQMSADELTQLANRLIQSFLTEAHIMHAVHGKMGGAP